MTDSQKISFRCPECNKLVSIAQQHAGKRGRCPGCGAVFQAPSTGLAKQAPTFREGDHCILGETRIRLDYAQGEQPPMSYTELALKTNQLLDDPLSDPEYLDSALARERQRDELDELQGNVLNRLVQIPEPFALAFFQSVGIATPVHLRNGNAERILTHMRTRARIGADEFGELYCLWLGASDKPTVECLYIHQGDQGGEGHGLLVCKLVDDTMFVYNTSGRMRETLKLT